MDAKTLKITKKIPLTGHPNNVAIRKDGRRLYVAIQMPDGGVDVIDTVAQERVKFIRVLRGVHNTFITPDSKFVVAGSTGGSVATVIDTATELPAWSIHFEGGVRPLCFETNPDGSTKRMFVQVTNLHGFAIVDWDKRKEVGRITLPDVPQAERNSDGIQGAPAHGILIAPDGKTLWSTSKINSHVYAYSMPDLKYLGGVRVGKVPDWLTFTPDSKKLYVANAHDNFVSVIDVAARKEIAKIKVGQVPKRNITARDCELNKNQHILFHLGDLDGRGADGRHSKPIQAARRRTRQSFAIDLERAVVARTQINRFVDGPADLSDDFLRKPLRIVHVIHIAQLVRAAHAHGRELLGPLAGCRANNHPADADRVIRRGCARQRDGFGRKWTNPPRNRQSVDRDDDWL